MTRTLDLPESVERVLERKARRRGIALDTYLVDLAAQDAANEESAEATRREAVKRGRGMFVGNGHETDDFMRERHEEGLREMERDGLRINGRSAGLGIGRSA